MEHRPQFEIDGLQRAEGWRAAAETFVGTHRGSSVKLCRRQVGADHVDAVECGLGGDAEGVLGEAERLVSDADVEMLGHVAPSRHRPDGLADCRGAAQWTARSLHAGRDARELLFGGGPQLGAFAAALFGQQRVFAELSLDGNAICDWAAWSGPSRLVRYVTMQTG